MARPAPEGGSITTQGHSYGIFQKALQRRDVVAALAAARELPQLSLEDALELTLLVARKDPRRHPRVAARWLRRSLEEDPAATIEEAGLAASAPSRSHRRGLPGGGTDAASHGRTGYQAAKGTHQADRTAPSSTDPSFRNGVTSAVPTPVNGILIAIRPSLKTSRAYPESIAPPATLPKQIRGGHARCA